MEKITSILAKKEPHFHTVSPTSSVDKALSQMCCENVEYLIVMDEDERYIGLITEHDITTKVLFVNRNSNNTSVAVSYTHLTLPTIYSV